jgi:DNA-binding CsgD family transcriptional regulator
MATAVVPIAMHELRLDRSAWNAIRCFAAAAGDVAIGRCGLVHRSDGSPVCLLMIEHGTERVPSLATIRLRYKMTGREAEVALLLARRFTQQEIAGQLGVSEHTARHHTERVLAKMGLHNRLAVRSALASLAESAASPRGGNSLGDRTGGDRQLSTAAPHRGAASSARSA